MIMHEVDGWVDEEMQKVSSWEKKIKIPNRRTKV